MKRSGLLTLLLLLGAALLLATVPGAAAASKKKRKAWTEKELEELEKQWEGGDAEEDLMSPERQHRLEMEAREKAKEEGKDAPPMPMGGGMNSGPVMMFVDLHAQAAPDGKAWQAKDIDALNRRWTQMLISGGVDAKFYNLDDKVLATFDRKLTQDTNEFLLEQPEVDFITLDSRKIYSKGRTG